MDAASRDEPRSRLPKVLAACVLAAMAWPAGVDARVSGAEKRSAVANPEMVASTPAWKRGMLRRAEDGSLVLDTSPAAMRLVREEERRALEAKRKAAAEQRRGAVTATCVAADGSPRQNVAAPAWIVSLVEGMAPNHRLDPRLVLAVIAAESNFQSTAVSPKNAQGLMQLIPDTQRRFGVSDPFNPQDNLRGGMRYLAWLLQYFKGDVIRALAGYNAGENAVDRHGGVPPYPETIAYVAKVRDIYGCRSIAVDADPQPQMPSPTTIRNVMHAAGRSAPPTAAETWTDGRPARIAGGPAPCARAGLAAFGPGRDRFGGVGAAAAGCR